MIVKASSVHLDLISIFHSGHLDFSSSISRNATVRKFNIFPMVLECMNGIIYVTINAIR